MLFRSPFIEIVALVPLLMGTPNTTFVEVANLQCALAAFHECLVGTVDVRLFSLEIGVFSHFWGL